MRLFETLFRGKIHMHRQSGEQTEVIVWMSDKEKTASAESIEEACLLGILSELADEYLLSCLPKQNEKKEGECIDSEQKGKSTKKRDGGDKREPKFPNVAGFCRYFCQIGGAGRKSGGLFCQLNEKSQGKKPKSGSRNLTFFDGCCIMKR